MTEENAGDMIAVKLDVERRREIDEIRKRMEYFLENQIEIKHAMELVTKGQDTLKERFEIGTANTLKELKAKFDQFLSEWGEARAENKHRDEKIAEAKKVGDEAVVIAEKAKDKAESIVMGFAYTLFGSAALVALIWALSLVLKRGP